MGIYTLCVRTSGPKLAGLNGERDHVHLLVNYPPAVVPSRLVNSLQGVSSRRFRQEYPGLERHYRRANRLWSGSYFAGSAGGGPISVPRQYIEQQPGRLTSARHPRNFPPSPPA